MVNVVETKEFKGLEAELAELNDLVRVGFALLENSADYRSDRQHGEQADGKPHRTQKFKYVLAQAAMKRAWIGHSVIKLSGRGQKRVTKSSPFLLAAASGVFS